jgi:hypothetical protein
MSRGRAEAPANPHWGFASVVSTKEPFTVETSTNFCCHIARFGPPRSIAMGNLGGLFAGEHPVEKPIWTADFHPRAMK